MRLYAEREKFEDELAAKHGKDEWAYLAGRENWMPAIQQPLSPFSRRCRIPSARQRNLGDSLHAAIYLHDYDAAKQVLVAIPPDKAGQMFDTKPPQSGLTR